MGQLTIADVRAKFPQYENLSDRELADAIHGTHYPNMDRGQFNRSIGLDTAPTGDVRPQPRPTPDPQAVAAEFAANVNALEFQSPPPEPRDPRIAPEQPQAPSAPAALPFIDQPPAAASPAPSAPIAPSGPIPARAMPNNPVPQLNGPGAGGGMQELIDLGVLPQRYVEDPFARPAPVQPAASAEPDPFDGEGFGPLAARRGQQFARGATEAFAALPEAVAVAMAGADNRDVASGEYKMALAERYEAELGTIDARIGEIEVALSLNGNPRPSRENRLDGNQRAALEAEYQEIMGRKNQISLAIGEGGLDAYRADALLDMTTRANLNEQGVVTPAGDRPMFAQGDRLRDASGEFFGVPDNRDTSFWSMVAEGGGNMTGMAVSALATTAVAGPIAGVSVAGAQGSGMNTASMYKEALEMGADEETAMEAASWGALIGASEIIPINRALKLLPPRLRGQIGQGFLRRFADIAQSSGEEAAQEYLATVANNIVAQQLYDAERGWTEGATEAALVGAILGAGTGTVGTLMDTRADAPAATPEIGPRNGEEPPQAQSDTAQPVAPNAEAEPVNAPAAPVAGPTSREAPAQPTMPEPPLPVDEMAALMQPAPTPALPADNQPAPAEPVGQDASSPQPPAGEPQLQSDPAFEAQAGDFNPDQWEAIQGMRDGQPTGRTWMTNAETGETISKQEYDTRLQARPAQSPEGGGTDAVGDNAVGDAPVQGDPAPTVDAGAARPSSDAGVITDQSGAAVDTAALADSLEGDEAASQARGALDFEQGKERVLPPYIDPTDDVAARAWYAGWDNANLLPASQRGAQSTAPRNQQTDWDTMTPDQRRDLMGQMEGTKTRDGSLNKTALKASERGWGALSDAARGKIAERWDALDQETKSPISSADAQGTADPAAQNQEPVKNEAPESVSMESTRDRWDAMSAADRVDFAARMNPSSDPAARQKFANRSWGSLLPQTQERINEAMQREFREGMSTAIDEGLKAKTRTPADEATAVKMLEDAGFTRHRDQNKGGSGLSFGRPVEGSQTGISIFESQSGWTLQATSGAFPFADMDLSKVIAKADEIAPVSEPTGAAADPAFQAAKDSGKLEVISVGPDGKTDKERGGRYLGVGGTTVPKRGDRPFDVAGKYWDSMTPDQRRDMIVEAAPGANPKPEFLAKSWADMPDSTKESITRRMPDAPFAEEASTKVEETAQDFGAIWDDMRPYKREKLMKDAGAAVRADGKLTARNQRVADAQWSEMTDEVKSVVEKALSDVVNDDQQAQSDRRAAFKIAMESVGDDMLTAMEVRHREILGHSPYKNDGNRFVDYLADGAVNGNYNAGFSLENKASRQVFEEFAGVKLPKTIRDTKTFLSEGAPFELTNPNAATVSDPDAEVTTTRDLDRAGRHWATRTNGERANLLDKAGIGAKVFNSRWEELSNSQQIDLANAMPERLFGDAPSADTVAEAAAEADTNPTDAQKSAGNYKMGHTSWNGLDITIENEKGSERSGTDPDGEAWSVTMPAHYGYIKRTEGADGDHVDVYIGEHTDSDVVTIIDQVNLDRSFDEHKVMIGFRNALEAQNTHRKAFSDGKGEQRRGGVTKMTVSEFKDWLENGDTSKPLRVSEATTDRDLDVAGRKWNGMINGQRRALLEKTDVAPGVSGIKWDKLSDDAQAKLANAMPDVVFAGAAKKEATQDAPPHSNRKEGDTAAQPNTDTDDNADQPTVRLGEHLASLIEADYFPSTNMQLMKVAADYFGGTIAEGAFSPKDAYEALELAMNIYATDSEMAENGLKTYDPRLNAALAKKRVTGLQNVLDTFPTQTRRDTETDAFQQFSTPPTYGYAVNWIANIKQGERVLEPSAGNGGIAIFAKNAGANVDVNELAERRVPSLKALGFDRVTTENAEQIANIWDGDASRSYDAVVMNPPFSASGDRGTKNTSATGAKHIDQALSMLKDGGRLVAIMGHTFQPGNSRVAPFFKRLEANGYSLRANVVVKGDQVYKKYGTTYDNRLLVIDKVAPVEGSETLKGEVGTIPELIDMMEGIRNEASNRRTKDDPVAATAESTRGDGGRAADVDGGQSRDGKPERVSKSDDLGGATDATGRDGRSDPADGKPARTNGDSQGTDGKRKARSNDAGKRPAGSSRATPDGSRKPTVRVTAAEQTKVEETSGGFAKYRPTRVRIEGAKEHPIALVESSAMATVTPPMPNYDLQLPSKMVKDGLISEAQLEQVMYAGAAHAEMLPANPDEASRRKGYYIGDGTGVGKTREIAGIIADNWAQGRKKHILISKDKKLLLGARRDFDNVGMKNVPIQDLGKVKATGDVDANATGVLFATYSTIGRTVTAGQKSRLDQIIEWVGPDFDGTITFDEAHLAGNAMPVKGKRGTSKPSATALAVVDLQKQLPNARVVYASATAATEVYNLAYADRLGLWGAGTAFPTVESFVTQIDKGGVAAMEVVARDMKQMGVYMARSISFDGVEYGKVEHELTTDQRAMYDAAAEGWQTVLANVQAVIEDHTEGGGRQRGAALAQFWGAHQRFFQQVLTSMQMPTVLSNIDADLKDGLSPVIQIVNTNEAATKRAMAKLEEGDSLDDIDITPREDLMQYLETSFPIHQYESYVDDNGNERQRPVQDSNGDYVVNKEAVRIRDELVGKLGSMTLPGNPLDMIIDKFGPDRVAEITGRSQRIVTKDGKRVKERRSQNKALAEAGEFQNAKRDVLIFSDAGGTGMDFHADKGVKNTKRRAHYVLQAGWRADRAIQGFGRTHRTNQAQPPIYKLAGTNLSGHKRFTSSIARRLDQLGALTKGQKDASGSSMFSATDNLENEFADTAVEALFYEIFRGDVEGFTPADAERELGLNLVGEKGFNVSKIPPVTQFLNRLLNTKIDRQNMLFDRFVEHMETAVQQAIEDGQFTAGVEAIEHDGAVLTDTKEAYRDTTTAATSQYQMVKLTKKVQVTPFVDIDTAYATIRYKKDRESGAVYAFRPASSRTNDRGQVIQTYHRYSPTDRSIIDSSDYQFRYDMIKPDEAELGWNEAIKDAPETREETLHMVTGALLPIWDRLPSSSPKIVRLQLDDGRSLLGREIPDIELTRTLENLGVTGPEIDMTGAEIQAAVLQGKTIVLSSGHKVVRRRVGGEQRIEIISPTDKTYSDTMPGGTLQKLGFQIEKINYKNRAFAGTSDKGLPAIDAFMAGKNIINVTMERDQVQGGPIQPYGDDMASGPVFKALSAQMRKMGLDDVQIQFDPSIAEQGKVYTDHFGKMVVTIGQTQNPRWTMGHEAMHIYRHMGLLSETEWNVLSAEAESKWLERYDIEARYPDLTKAERIEEAVAEAFGEVLQKSAGFRTTGPVRAAFRQINNFLKAVRNWSKGLGLKTPEDVMEAMARGEFAKRKDVDGWESQTSRLIKQRRQPNDIERKQGGMFLPDRYVWDTLAHGNGSIFARIKEAKGALGDRMDLVRTRIQDRFLPVLRAQQVIERQMKGPIPEELNAYLAEEMYSGRAGYKLDMIDQDYTSKIIQIIGNTKGVTTETVGRFLYARHAAERNKRIAEINPDMPDGGSGMGTAEADAILKDIKASPQASAYEDIAEMIDKLREWTIQERVDMGLMTKDEANGWRKSYDAYVPLKGWAETDFSDAELDVTGIGRGYNVRGDETRRALGRKTEAFNPLVAAITQAQEVAVRGEKNRVGQHLYRLAKDVPAKGLWEVKKTETTRVFNESTGLVEERNMSPITMMQAANEMAVKVDGEEHRIIFNDHRLARSATRVGVDNLGAIMTPLSMFSRYISTINTMLNPEFVLTNFARDTVTANVNMQSKELGTKIQKGMMRDLPKAMAGAYRGIGGKSDTEWSKYFQEFSEAGAKVSFWVMENPQANQSSIEKRMKREANGAKGVALALVTPSTDLNPVLNAMNRINLAVDNAIRLAAFVNARRNGLTPQQAASLSKNLTVNFNRRGDYGSAINAAYVFANAAMQGTHIMFKALKTRRVQAIVTGMVLLSYLLDQANAYLSEEDEDGQLAYDKLPGYRSERSLIIMLGPDAGDALTIPMPYGYNVFTYMGNRLSKMQRGAITPEEAMGDTALAAFNSFSPISGGSFMGMITPTVLDPALDIAVNEDWLGRPIYPDYPNMTGPDSQRFFGSVTDGSRLIAEKMNAWTGGTYAESGYVDVSPETLDHISGYLTGGTGRFFGRTTDLFSKIFRGEDVEINDVPIARTLYTDTGEWLDRSQYFDRRTAIREANAAAKAYTENGDPVPAGVQWMADLYPVQLQAERYRRGTSKVAQDTDRAYLLLNTAYLRAWQANTPYSSESIFD